MKVDRFPKKSSSINPKTFFLFIYIGLWVSCIAMLLYRNLSGSYEFPKTSFLNAFVTRFGDFYGTYDHWVRLGWGSVEYGLSYFPATYFIHTFFDFFLFTPQDAMKVLHFLTFGFIFQIIRRFSGLNSRKSLIFFLLFCSSYPVIFSFSTGNLELVFFSLFIYAYFILETKPKKSAIVLGLAAAPKLVLLIFVILFFNNKKSLRSNFKLAGFSFGSAIFANIAALILLPKGILDDGFSALPKIVKGTLQSIDLYQELMIFSGSGLHFGHSLLGALHVFFGMDFINTPRQVYLFSIVLLAVNLCLLFVAIKRGTSQSKLGLLIAITFCLSLPTSTDYRLIYVGFFLLTVLFQVSLAKGELPIYALIGLALAITSQIPKPYLYLVGSPYIGMNVWFTPIGLVLAQIFLIRGQKFK